MTVRWNVPRLMEPSMLRGKRGRNHSVQYGKDKHLILSLKKSWKHCDLKSMGTRVTMNMNTVTVRSSMFLLAPVNLTLGCHNDGSLQVISSNMQYKIININYLVSEELCEEKQMLEYFVNALHLK
jgi:hypothetical protein